MLGKVLLISAVLAVASGYPNGPPPEACVDRIPGHGVESLPKDTCPYMIIGFPWIPGEFVQVGILAVDDKEQKKFRGFAAAVTLDDVPIGVMRRADDLNRPKTAKTKLNCDDTTISHANNRPKSEILFEWQAPEDLDPNTKLRLRLTIVGKNTDEQWVDCNVGDEDNYLSAEAAPPTTTTEGTDVTEPTTTTSTTEPPTTEAATTEAATTEAATTEAATTTTASTTTTSATTAAPTTARRTTTPQPTTTTTTPQPTTTDAPTTTTTAPTTTTTTTLPITTQPRTPEPTTVEDRTPEPTTTEVRTPEPTTTEVRTPEPTTTTPETTTTTKEVVEPTVEIQTAEPVPVPTDDKSEEKVVEADRDTTNVKEGKPTDIVDSYLDYSMKMELKHHTMSDMACEESGAKYKIVEGTECGEYEVDFGLVVLKYQMKCPPGKDGRPIKFDPRVCACADTSYCPNR